MGLKKIFTEIMRDKLNTAYLNYIHKCIQYNIKPNWTDFKTWLVSENPEFNGYEIKQINNKVNDYRKIFGNDQWPSFKDYIKRDDEKFFNRLYERSEQSFFLALEVYNRIKIENKIEAFSILIVNAWELLFKGYIAQANGRQFIYYENDTTRTITCTKALYEIITNQNDPVRRNIERMIELRDQATHLLIPELQPPLSRLFQANVFNFIDYYFKLTGKRVNFGKDLFLLSLVVDGETLSNPCVAMNIDATTRVAIDKFLKELNEEEEQRKDVKFTIPIEYKLALTKKTDDSDICISVTNGAEKIGLIIEKTKEMMKDPDKSYPFIAKDIIKKINNSDILKNSKNKRFTSHTFQTILKKEKIKKDKINDYYFSCDKTNIRAYSDKLISLIENKIKSDPEYIDKCLIEYKNTTNYRKKNKK